MKRYIRSFFYSLLTVAFIISYTSCKKFVQVGGAKNQVTTATVFADSTDATAAILGIYINMMGSSSTINMFHGGVTIYTGLSGDELVPHKGLSDENEFYTNGLSVSDVTNGGLWTSAYTWIYQANACIEGVTGSTNISDTWKNQLIGEAKFMRALLYFHLVNLFGDIPLITSTDYQTNASIPRTSSEQVYQQIIMDLQDAQQLLVAAYPSTGRVRPNQYAATALLAKVYLYHQDWAKAEAAATTVISSPNYSLVANLNNVFLAGSNEAILQFIPLQAGSETAEGYNFIPSSTTAIPSYAIGDSLLNAFNPGDLRMTSWLGKNTVTVAGTPTTYYYPFKYQHGRDGLSTPKDYYMVLRLGEQYLIRAEARAQQGQGHLNDAAADLNMILARAGFTGGTSASTQQDLLTAIYHERQVELFCESGNRWYDLRRTGRANSVMSIVTPEKGGAWKSGWQFYPIPYSEIQANSFLTQNPDYLN